MTAAMTDREPGRSPSHASRNGLFMSRCRVELPENFGNARKWPEINVNKWQHDAT
jgi:hypothetical protein